MLTKDKIIETIQAMPEKKFEDIDVLFERLIILEKIERGVADIEAGRTITHEELKKKMETWFNK
jgi:predicted transcriptional regulator